MLFITVNWWPCHCLHILPEYFIVKACSYKAVGDQINSDAQEDLQYMLTVLLLCALDTIFRSYIYNEMQNWFSIEHATVVA